MYWADRVAKEIISSRKYKPYHIDDMFTLSGFAHVGSLRGPIIHDLVYRALRGTGQQAVYTYVFNDFDPIDGLPQDLQERFSKYLGCPLKSAPSPETGYDNFADYFAQDFKKVLVSLGVQAEYLSSWELYHEGKFDDVIRTALGRAEEIQEVLHRISGREKRAKGWVPLQVICEQCGKLGTTRAYDWDGKTVAYTCEPELVKWAQGCGSSGRIVPFGGNAKLLWKVDWPAHWKVIGVTIEGEGKDHAVAGGSRDVARELCKLIFNYPEPFDIPYEHFLLGGKKMSSSKGLGLKARDLTELVPPVVARFLFARTDRRQALEFDPVGTMIIPDLFDEYDRCWKAYNTGSNEDLARTFEMSQIDEVPVKDSKLFIPRFRDVVTYIQQPNISIEQKFTEIKGESLTDQETVLLEERISYARVWIERYAPEEFRLHMKPDLPVEIEQLDGEQKNYLESIIQLIESDLPADQLQTALYESAKKLGIDTKRAFAAIYLAFIGKTHGPKAGWFLCQYPKETVIFRLKEASKL